MKLALLTISAALCCGFASGASAMANDGHKAAKTRIEAEFKDAKGKCKAIHGNARNVCMAEAKGRNEVAKAELEQQYEPSPRHEAKVKSEKAEAGYKVARQKCEDLKGNAKDVCKKDAKAAFKA